MKQKIVFLLVLYINSLNGQQWNHFSLASRNLYLDNPAYGGFDRSISLALQYRSQWDQLSNAPKALLLNAHMPLYSINSGAGIDLYNQSDGLLTMKGIRASYNYIIPTSLGLFSIGARVQIMNLGLDGSRILTPEGTYTDGIIVHNDLGLDKNFMTVSGIGYEYGCFFESSNFRAGISFAETPKHKVSKENFAFSLASRINFSAQYLYTINQSVNIQPSINIKNSGNIFQTEFGVVSTINGSIFGGIQLRGYGKTSLDAVSFILGHRFNKSWSVYYGYDLGISSLRNVHDGSHEILVKMNIFDAIKPSRMANIEYSPRFLN